jgi:predicted ATP-dependent endonuclease of OLD family
LDFYCRANEKEWIKGPLDDVNYGVINEFKRKYFNNYFTREPNDNDRTQEVHKIYDRFALELVNQLPDVFFIPQFRQITPGEKYSIKGTGIVEMLASWQHPEITLDSHIERFLKIQDLLRRLLNLPDIEMEVVHTRDQIIVKNGTLRLPLDSYGTGIHELIILAAAVYSQDNAIFCIEEPEIHLHPKLQKEFMSFLINETNNKYLITTHSNALIVLSDDVEVTHLRLIDEATVGRSIESSAHTLDLLHDLGIRPSDILQANCVIWVEGPSDRIYIKKWLTLICPDLREGVDYSIMFYGGRLLSHLSLERDIFPNPDDLIPLLRINQNTIILIDSDRKKHGARINNTKNRVKKECDESGLYCWITDGREIENYISNRSISLAYSQLTGIEKNIEMNKYNDLETTLKRTYKKSWKNKWSYNSSKPDMARIITTHITGNDISSDLRKHLGRVVSVIKSV